MGQIRKNFKWVVLLLVVFGVAFRAILNASQLLVSWDESIYAQLGVEFIKTPDFIARYNTQLWFEKPPLIALISALPQYLFPYQKWALESIFNLLALACLWMVYGLSKKILDVINHKQVSIFGFKLQSNSSPYLSFLPVGVLLCSSLFIERSLIANVDILLALSYLGYFRFYDSKWARTFFTIVGVFSKSLLGFLPILIDLVWNFKRWQKPKNLLHLVLTIVLASSWFIYAFLNYGTRFISEHFGDHLFKRATQTVEFHSGDLFYYAMRTVEQSGFVGSLALLATLAIVVFLIVKSVLSLGKNKLQPQTKWLMEFLSTGVLYFILINLSQSKLDWYILPATIWFGFFLMIFVSIFPHKTLKIGGGLIILCLGLLNLYTGSLPSRNSEKDSELAGLAKCMQGKKYTKIGFLVDADERQNYEKIKDSSQILSSSFRYGGTPIFIYYLGKPVEFFYDFNTFKSKYKNYQAVVISYKDIDYKGSDLVNFTPSCESKNFVEFIKTN